MRYGLSDGTVAVGAGPEQSHEALCPACRRINDKCPARVVGLRSALLPRRIGEAVKRAVRGSLDEDFDEGGYFVRVNWGAAGT
jgi:hypothetical protein